MTEDSAELDRLVATCLAEAEEHTSEQVRKACSVYPEHASDIWNQFLSLRGAGLLGSLTAADSREASALDIGIHRAPESVGPYRILSELGRGGQAVVYLAEDTRLNRPVALKLLKGVGRVSGPILQRFRREAEVASRLDHPGICPVYEAGSEEDAAYIAMRYVPGRSLAALISEPARDTAGRPRHIVLQETDTEEPDFLPRQRPQRRARSSTGSTSASGEEIRRVLQFAEQAARALHVAHEAKIVHRDIKPGNIMVTPGAEPVILDFGLAGSEEEAGLLTLTRTGDVMGTPAYMSPEQVRGRPGLVDRRTDVYSLGATLYQCLTLRLPFEADSREALHRAILEDMPPDPRKQNPRISSDLKVVLETALEKDANRRYQTALDLAEDLRRVQNREPIAARPLPAVGRLLRWARLHPARASLWLVLLIGVTVVTGLSGFILATGPTVERQARREALERLERHLEEGFHKLGARHVREASEAFDAALALKPDSPEAVFGRAFLLFENEKYQDCLDLLDRNRSVVDRLRALLQLRADAQEKLGRAQEAEELRDRVSEPTTSVGYYLSALNADPVAGGESKAAAERIWYDSLLAVLTASGPRLLYVAKLAHNAVLLARHHKIEPAKRELARIEQVARSIVSILETNWPDQPLAWIAAGEALESFDIEAAIAAYRHGIDLDPRGYYSNQAHRGLARVLSKNNR